MKITIYNTDRAALVEAYALDRSSQDWGIMTDNTLSLEFETSQCVILPPGCYVEFDGTQFFLLEEYRPTMLNKTRWQYNVAFRDATSLLSVVAALNTMDGKNTPLMVLTAPAYEHALIVISNMNRFFGDITWAVGEIVSTENIEIDYTGKYCSDILTELCSKTDLEWWFDGYTLNIGRCEFGELLELGYMNGLLGDIECSQANNALSYAYLYPIGSTRNIDPTQYGNDRLQLPDGIVRIPMNSKGIAELVEETAFAGIYPRYVATVSAVRTEQRTNEDGTPFTIYYVADNNLPFDPNKYEIAGLVKQITFQSGELMGREFEVNFNSDTKEIEIITQFPYEDIQLPGGVLVPAIGDQFVIWNITMPLEYYTLASQEFLEAARKFAEDTIKDTSVYRALTDYINIQGREIKLVPGQRVRLLSDYYFPDQGYYDSRITHISRDMGSPYIVFLEISAVRSMSTLARLAASVKNNEVVFRQLSASIPPIVKSWEETAATDSNIYSARKSEKEFLNKRKGGVVHGKTTFSENVVLGNGINTADFVDAGMAGAGFGVTRDANGNTVISADIVVARKKAEFFEIVINQTSFELGDTIKTAAGCTITSVEVVDDAYRCFYDNHDGTRLSGFKVGDQARCQRYDASYDEITKYYWRVVKAVGANYVDLYIYGVDENGIALTDGDGVPAEGDDIVLFGSRIDQSRQSAIVISALNGGAVYVYSHISSFSLSEKNFVGFGTDPQTNEAFMQIYGDLYIGDRDTTAEDATFLRFTKGPDGKRRLNIAADVRLGKGSTFGEMEYLRNAFLSGSVLDVDGVTLSALVGVKDINGNVIAGLYGGTSKILNDTGYYDAEHGTMLLFGGIEGVDKPKTYKTAIYEDGYLESTKFATGRKGKRIEIVGNEFFVYGDDARQSVLRISYDEAGKPYLGYYDASTGEDRWYLSESGISTSYTIAQVDDILKHYMHLSTTQEVEARHNFANGLKIGNLPIYKSQDDVIYIDANVVLRGGLTMFGTNGTTAPSIFEALPIDGTTIKWVDGVLTAIGGGTIEGISLGDVEQFLKEGNYATVLDIATALTPYAKTTEVSALVSNYLPLSSFNASNIKTTLGISDWALASSLEWGAVNGRPTKLSQFTDDVVAGKYLPLSGGTVNGMLTVRRNALVPFYVYNTLDGASAACLRFVAGEDHLGSIGSHLDGYLYRYSPDLSKNYKVWDSGNFTPSDYLPLIGGILSGALAAPSFIGDLTGNADTATKLATPRTIWGRSFDGSGNVVGDLILQSSTANGTNSDSAIIRFNGGNFTDNPITGPSIRSIFTSAYGRKRLAIFQHDADDYTTENEVVSVLPNGNVGIGTNVPTAKLHVNGDTIIDGDLTLNGGVLTHSNGVWTLNGDLLVTGGVTQYALEGRDASTIMDAVVVDGVTISKDGGVLRYIGAVGGGGIDEEQLEDYLSSNDYITSSALAPYATSSSVSALLGNYLPLSSFTKATIKNTLGISDWALASAKPTYTASEVGALGVNDTAANANKLGGYLPAAYMSASGQHTDSLNNLTSLGIYRMSGTVKDGPADANGYGNLMVVRSNDWDTLAQLYFNVYNNRIFVRNGTQSSLSTAKWNTLAFADEIPTKLSQFTDDVVAGKYLPLSGGYLRNSTPPLTIDRILGGRGYSSISYQINGTLVGILGFDVDGNLDVSPNRVTNSDYYRVLHSSNYSNYALPKDGTAVAATKLATPRTIWGQSFDGTGNVDGDLTLNGGVLTHSNGVWTLNGDLLVTGGVTMFGNAAMTLSSISEEMGDHETRIALLEAKVADLETEIQTLKQSA